MWDKRSLMVIAILIALLVPALLLACSATNTTSSGNLIVHIADLTGSPLWGAKVVSNTQPAAQLKVTGITGDSGTVTFKNIAAGRYQFYISRFDYEYKEFEVTVKAGQTTEITINLTGDSQVTTTT